eukprot:m.47602 g.47602  ORF g.47602 m.47602 type:complete len:530 (+) comp8873_c0_seq1:96-1685(+)
MLINRIPRALRLARCNRTTSDPVTLCTLVNPDGIVGEPNGASGNIKHGVGGGGGGPGWAKYLHAQQGSSGLLAQSTPRNPTASTTQLSSVSAGTANAGEGAVLGALVGDAAGAPLEFPVAGTMYHAFRWALRCLTGRPEPSMPPPRRLFHAENNMEAVAIGLKSFVTPTGALATAAVDDAMQMKGWGVHGVAPGQITDDGEMTMAMLTMLARTDPGVYRRGDIGWAYFRWIVSNPFDIGNTIRGAAEGIDELGDLADGRSIGYNMTTVASMTNGNSLANGSLMRATPIGVWAHRLAEDDIAHIASLDSGLTHPNELCCAAVAAYSIAIAHLVRTGTPLDLSGSNASDAVRRRGAFNSALAWAAGTGPDCTALDDPQKSARGIIAEWLVSARNGEKPPYQPQIGYLRIGFMEAFRHLHAGTPFKVALRETLEGGGDTDTNAAIVGGLLGAACGRTGLPQDMVEAVLNCNTSLASCPRPDMYHPLYAPDLVRKALETSPEAGGLVTPRDELITDMDEDIFDGQPYAPRSNT